MFEDEYREAYDLLKKAIFNMVDKIIYDRESSQTAIRSLLARAIEIDNAMIVKMNAALEDMARLDGDSNGNQ